MIDEITMKFSFGALKEIKAETKVDLFDPSKENKEKDIKPENFQRIAQAGIRWSKPGVTDTKAEELSNFVTIGEVLMALRDSFKTDEEAVED